ncbi:hypothetical protein QBC44DRAFT_324188 [Cladorrhinum sp. PSN332]|nr:hypothetical protein QBC44DRAFT_324188 [Cladorrhinum sp. PSN332]
MLRTALTKSRVIAARTTRQLHTTRPRFEAYKPGSAPAEKSARGGNTTYAIVSALVLGVGGYYGLLMGSPRTAVPPENKGSMAGTSVASKRANESAEGKVNPNRP